ncbi:MAG: hypothetical protein ABJZ55_22180 [Fuerstiella sp.]
MNNGQVFGGRLIARTDGYDVILPSGRMYVSSDRIRFLATSMQDAYEKMSNSVQNRTPTIHVQMARWCLTNGLHSAARRELLDALHLDPDYRLAQTMLEGLARQAKRAEANAASSQDIVAQMSAQRTGVSDRRSLGGLPVGTARTFTVRIQTLLSNNCGNAKCHSGGQSTFQFVNTRRSSSVVIAEQNLASILKQIDLADPASSPLLVKAASMHGGARSPLFSGRSGRAQMQMLQDWVNEVSDELNPLASSSGSRSVDRESQFGIPDQMNRANPIQQASYEPDVTVSGPADELKIQQRSKTETDGQFGQAAREAVRDNPFDPMIFNRRYHGQAGLSR